MVNGTIDPSAVSVMSSTVTVAAPAGVTDTDNSNDSASLSDLVGRESDLSLDLSAHADVAQVGDTIHYTLEAAKTAPAMI